MDEVDTRQQREIEDLKRVNDDQEKQLLAIKLVGIILGVEGILISIFLFLMYWFK